MIELITGLPGNAKTLYTIGEVKKRAELENRAVYYAGIKELQLDWTEIDPLKWNEVVPSGAIIVIDECQKIFRNRSMGSQPPKYVSDLEEHRHKGLDFYLITQHPSLIDPAIRRLTQVHKHLIRIYGMEASTVHKWNVCTDNPDKAPSRKDSEKVRWGFDRTLYGVYKSADEHTMRRSIPLRLKLLALVPVLIGLAFWAVYKLTVGKVSAGAEVSAPKAVPTSPGAVAARRPVSPLDPGQDGLPSRPVPFDPVADAERFVQQATPRVEGLAYTAPKYDAITAPVRAPVPAACVQKGNDCKCYSQQATPLDVTFNMCLGFARNGFFQEFDADGDRRESERTARATQVLDDRGQGKAMPNGFSQVAAFTNPPPDPPHVPRVGKGS